MKYLTSIIESLNNLWLHAKKSLFFQGFDFLRSAYNSRYRRTIKYLTTKCQNRLAAGGVLVFELGGKL